MLRYVYIDLSRMISILLPIVYGSVFIYMLVQAFRLMRTGFTIENKSKTANSLVNDRTGKLTIHPEIVDQSGSITKEELLTVRFSDYGQAETTPL